MHSKQITLAALKNRLQIPMIVRDYLEDSSITAAEIQYGMNDMLSNFKSEDAVLSIAFAMSDIATLCHDNDEQMSLLKMECDRLIERYAARDRMSQHDPDHWHMTQAQMIPVIAEDIDGFLELLEMCHMTLDITAPRPASILTTFIAQLGAHGMIMDTIKTALMTEAATHAHRCATPFSDNIIPFPTARA